MTSGEPPKTAKKRDSRAGKVYFDWEGDGALWGKSAALSAQTELRMQSIARTLTKHPKKADKLYNRR